MSYSQWMSMRRTGSGRATGQVYITNTTGVATATTATATATTSTSTPSSPPPTTMSGQASGNVDHLSVLYGCHCGTYKSLNYLYYCKSCTILHCVDCALLQVDTWFCPACLNTVFTSRASQQLFRCEQCVECPSCFHTLSTVAKYYNEKHTHNNKLDNDHQNNDDGSTSSSSSSNATTMYGYYCEYCHWSSSELEGLPLLSHDPVALTSILRAREEEYIQNSTSNLNNNNNSNNSTHSDLSFMSPQKATTTTTATTAPASTSLSTSTTDLTPQQAMMHTFHELVNIHRDHYISQQPQPQQLQSQSQDSIKSAFSHSISSSSAYHSLPHNLSSFNLDNTSKTTAASGSVDQTSHHQNTSLSRWLVWRAEIEQAQIQSHYPHTKEQRLGQRTTSTTTSTTVAAAEKDALQQDDIPACFLGHFKPNQKPQFLEQSM